MRKHEAYEVQAKASAILGIKNKEEGVISGVGSVLAKSAIGFNTDYGRVAPDIWYLPEDRSKPAMLVICMAPDFDIMIENCYSEELLKLCMRTFTGPNNYEHLTGVLYNGNAIRVFKSDYSGITEVPKQKELLAREYYLNLWNKEEGA